MKIKKQPLDNFLDEKISKSKLEKVIGGNSNGSGGVLILNDETKDPPQGPGGNGITTASIREGSNP